MSVRKLLMSGCTGAYNSVGPSARQRRDSGESIYSYHKEDEFAHRQERKCRVCGCTEDDCRQCIKASGRPCHWVEEDLCSRCQNKMEEGTLL